MARRIKKIITEPWLFIIILSIVFFGLALAISQTLAGDTNTNTSATVLNALPAFSVDPSDGSSDGTTPTNVGANVSFSATATDTNSDQWKLLICKTSGTTGVACDGGGSDTWCNSTSFVNTGSANTCTYTALVGDAESNAWYAYACDATGCSTASQGTTSPSPFKVNHKPSFTVISDNDPIDPGDTVTFTATASDTDTDTANDTVKLYVCFTASFTSGANPACAAEETVCVSDPSASNPACNYAGYTVPYDAGDETYYTYLVDSHGLLAAGGAVYTVSGLMYNYGGNSYGAGANGGDSYICNGSTSLAASCQMTLGSEVAFNKGEDGSHDYNLCLYQTDASHRFVLVVDAAHMATSGACETLASSLRGQAATVGYFQEIIFDSNGAGASYTHSMGGGLTLQVPPAYSPAYLSAAATDYRIGAVTVNNIAPVVSSVVLVDKDDSGDLTLDTESDWSTGYQVTFTVSDDNGCWDVDDINEVQIYRSGIAQANCVDAGDFDLNSCYNFYNETWDGLTESSEDVGSCDGAESSDTDDTWTFTFPLASYADPTDANSAYAAQNWLASVEMKDKSSVASDLTESSSGTDLVCFTASNVTTTSIAYGSLNPGGDSADKTIIIQATGNTGLDGNIYGTAMASGGNSIAVGQQKSSLSEITDWTSGTLWTHSSSDPTARQLNVLKTTSGTPANVTLHWMLRVPNPQASGSYTGTTAIIGTRGDNPTTEWQL